MKKNTKTYLLITAVLAIWGAIGYQIFNGINSNAPEAIHENIDVAFNPKTIIVTDTFSIKSVDRDPFLGTITGKKTRKRIKSTNTKVKDTTSMAVSYQGLVKQKNSRHEVFVITLDGMQHLLKKGQVVNNMKLLSGDDKEVLIRYNNIKKTIVKQ